MHRQGDTDPLSLLPSVEAVLASPDLASFGDLPRVILRERVRDCLAGLRAEIRCGAWRPTNREDALRRVLAEAAARAGSELSMRLRRVWNATGILLHTNLGRAVLPLEARRSLLDAAAGYSSLEIDLATGGRRSRLDAIRELVPLLTGSEAGFAVNNCAGALFLAMASLGAGREVLVSRGQLVEIGGSFRLPEILEAAGVRLREVGTTNRTRIGDYARARTAETALVLRVHRSNFRLVGFSEEPSLGELVDFCRKEGLTLVDDLGSGALRAYRDLFPGEPCIEESIEGGADLVCVSADKLLGLAQAGIIAGKRDVVEKMARHPIARVVRLDKTLVSVLESGLRLHLIGGEEARRRIPLLRALSRAPDEIARAAERCADRLRVRLGEGYRFASVEVRAEVGGGSLPGVETPSSAVLIHAPDVAAVELSARLRAGDPPVIGRIQEDRVLLDLRGIEEEDEPAFLDAVSSALEQR